MFVAEFSAILGGSRPRSLAEGALQDRRITELLPGPRRTVAKADANAKADTEADAEADAKADAEAETGRSRCRGRHGLWPMRRPTPRPAWDAADAKADANAEMGRSRCGGRDGPRLTPRPRWAVADAKADAEAEMGRNRCRGRDGPRPTPGPMPKPRWAAVGMSPMPMGWSASDRTASGSWSLHLGLCSLISHIRCPPVPKLA